LNPSFHRCNDFIRAEIQEIIDGKITVEDSALRHAPHTALSVVSGDWDRGYSREKGGYPVADGSLMAGESISSGMKYWPPVSRIDGAAKMKLIAGGDIDDRVGRYSGDVFSFA
jgi:hypothetical protein